MNKVTAAAVLTSALFISVAILIQGSAPPTLSGVVNTVSQVAGKQVIEIAVKGGYTPQKIIAKAGVPTILKLTTNGTFDCSSAVRIPSMGINKFLPPSGSTDIDLGEPRVGTLQGLCAMGMYSFQVDFRG